jgi:hypothetical protein
MAEAQQTRKVVGPLSNRQGNMSKNMFLFNGIPSSKDFILRLNSYFISDFLKINELCANIISAALGENV